MREEGVDRPTELLDAPLPMHFEATAADQRAVIEDDHAQTFDVRAG